MPVCLEETAILDKLEEAERLDKKDLSEREEIIVKKMVTRGLLERQSTTDGIYFYLTGHGEY